MEDQSDKDEVESQPRDSSDEDELAPVNEDLIRRYQTAL